MLEILQEILVGNLVRNSCRTGRSEKNNLRKAMIVGNLAFQIGWRGTYNQDPDWEILRENLMGKSGGKLLQENLVRNSCGKCCGKFRSKILWEILREILAEKFLWENLAGKSCRKNLWENHVGNSGRKMLQDRGGKNN